MNIVPPSKSREKGIEYSADDLKLNAVGQQVNTVDFKDYYKILGIEPSASAEDIKRTYKKLARKYHPDVSDEPDAQAKFQEVSEAYEVLKDKDKRAEYDELREYVNNPNRFRNAGGGQHFQFDGNFSAEDQFEDLLRSIFGDARGFDPRGRSGGSAPRGRDIHHRLHITLEEAYAGGSRMLRLGTMNGEKTINVKIPKGIAEGRELRLKGQGETGRGGEAGDLYLQVEFEKHPLYDVEGDNVTLVLPVAPWEAALGTSVEVPTLGGRVNLRIPSNSQNGSRLRL
ncbi:MAG: DnaJ domain-containing protein, partial [Pseudomonadales bacterium]|nr:DnaJ domain-containing protein [Pseudomonadales bacterium]